MAGWLHNCHSHFWGLTGVEAVYLSDPEPACGANNWASLSPLIRYGDPFVSPGKCFSDHTETPVGVKSPILRVMQRGFGTETTRAPIV